MAEWPGTGELRDWQEYRRDRVTANNACPLDILERLRADGPLPWRELPDTCVVPWAPSGWNDDRNLTTMLDFLVQRGEVAVAGGMGRDRLWDLASRVYPEDPAVPAEEARRLRDERRLSALGIARSRGPECPVELVDVGETGEPAVVEGPRPVAGRPRAARQPFAGRAALLSPFDRLLADRKRMKDVSEFDHHLEIYKPATERRGATTPSRSCTATGWSGSWTPAPTARPGCSASRRSTATCRSGAPWMRPSTARSATWLAGST